MRHTQKRAKRNTTIKGAKQNEQKKKKKKTRKWKYKIV